MPALEGRKGVEPERKPAGLPSTSAIWQNTFGAGAEQVALDDRPRSPRPRALSFSYSASAWMNSRMTGTSPRAASRMMRPISPRAPRDRSGRGSGFRVRGPRAGTSPSPSISNVVGPIFLTSPSQQNETRFFGSPLSMVSVELADRPGPVVAGRPDVGNPALGEGRAVIVVRRWSGSSCTRLDEVLVGAVLLLVLGRRSSSSSAGAEEGHATVPPTLGL